MSIRTAASARSAWRGYEYYTGGRVCFAAKLDAVHYGGAVSGSEANPYEVVIDLEHPKRSTCSCPFANGRKVCKHMVAVFFAAFPDAAKQYKAEIDQAIKEAERYEEELPERIEQYINKLTKNELCNLALSLIDQLPEYEFDCFVRDYIEAEYDYDG